SSRLDRRAGARRGATLALYALGGFTIGFLGPLTVGFRSTGLAVAANLVGGPAYRVPRSGCPTETGARATLRRSQFFSPPPRPRSLRRDAVRCRQRRSCPDDELVGFVHQPLRDAPEG